MSSRKLCSTVIDPDVVAPEVERGEDVELAALGIDRKIVDLARRAVLFQQIVERDGFAPASVAHPPAAASPENRRRRNRRSSRARRSVVDSMKSSVLPLSHHTQRSSMTARAIRVQRRVPRRQRLREQARPAERTLEIARVAERDAVGRAEFHEESAAFTAELVCDVEVLEELRVRYVDVRKAVPEERARAFVEPAARRRVAGEIIPEKRKTVRGVERRKLDLLHTMRVVFR